jgi:hypothetical protein
MYYSWVFVLAPSIGAYFSGKFYRDVMRKFTPKKVEKVE